MPDWLLTILVGGVIVSLIGLVYKGVLTKAEHAEMCKTAHQLTNENFKGFVKDEMRELKDYLDIKIENVILKEIRENGKRKIS